MKTIAYIIVCLTLCSCLSKSDLEGTWVGDYRHSTDKKYEDMLFPERRVMTFKNGNCMAHGSVNDFSPTKEIGTVNIFSRDLTLESGETFKIESVDSDSLVFHLPNNSSRYVYRKLDDSLKFDRKVELIGRTFRWENSLFSDTVYLKNDQRIRRQSRNPKRRYEEYSWERIQHEGFDILFFDTDGPYVIEKSSDSTVHLRSFHKSGLLHLWTEMK